MDVDEARAVLGLGPTEGWDAVRPAYRRMIREMHPDRAGAASTTRAARVNEAYAVLVRAKRSQTAGARTARTAAGGQARPRHGQQAPDRGRRGSRDRGPAWLADARLDGADSLFLALPFEEAFAALLAAADQVGDLSYVDRSSGIFEAIVQYGGEACSLLATLATPPPGRGQGTEALFVLEVLGRVASPSPAPVVRRLLVALQEQA